VTRGITPGQPGAMSSVVGQRFAGEFLRKPLPLTADAIEPDGAQFELIAEPPQDGRLVAVLVVADRAGDVVGPFPLLAIVEQRVLALPGSQPFERFGIDADPEQREIADVAVDFPLGTFDALVGFEQHVGDFFEPPPDGVPDPENDVDPAEPDQKVAEIVDERRVGHPQVDLKRVLGQGREQSLQRLFTRHDMAHLAGLLRRKTSSVTTRTDILRREVGSYQASPNSGTTELRVAGHVPVNSTSWSGPRLTGTTARGRGFSRMFVKSEGVLTAPGARLSVPRAAGESVRRERRMHTKSAVDSRLMLRFLQAVYNAGLLAVLMPALACAEGPVEDEGRREQLQEPNAEAPKRPAPGDFRIPPVMSNPAKAAARPGVIVLFDGRVIGGKVEEVAAGYLLTRPDGFSETIPSAYVRVSAETLDAAYEKMRDSIRVPLPHEHVELAQWCAKQGLLDAAQEQLTEALRLDPNRRDARELLKQIDAMLHQKPIHAAADTPQPRTGDGFIAPEARTATDVSRETTAAFVRRAQPLLLNKCGNAACHGPQTTTPFQLAHVRSGAGSRAATLDNLQAVLRRIDARTPETSPLLESLATGAHKRVFQGQAGKTQRIQLEDWLRLAAVDLEGGSDVAATPKDFPDVIAAMNVVPAKEMAAAGLKKAEEPPKLRAIPKETLLRAVLEEERPDPFDPEAFNRAVHGAEAEIRRP